MVDAQVNPTFGFQRTTLKLDSAAGNTRYIDHYNHERPHQSLDYRTPHQAFLNPKPAA